MTLLTDFDSIFLCSYVEEMDFKDFCSCRCFVRISASRCL